MGWKDFLNKLTNKKPQPSKNEAPTHWIKCPSCGALSFYKEVAKENNTCPKCGYHFRMDANDRIKLLADEGTFVEYDANLEPVDPLHFVDKKSYQKRIEEGYKKRGKK